MTLGLNHLLSKLIAFCAQKHEGQTDKAGKPYILHVLAVMNFIAVENPDDYELMCIAVCHDVIEDTKTSYKELIELGATDRVIEGIKALTKVPGQTEEEYQLGVLANPDAIKVKKKDIIHNSDIRRLKGLSEKDFARAQKYQKFYVRLCEEEDAQRQTEKNLLSYFGRE